MSSIVKMYDASNNDVYPITHLRAVRDSNGTTLESMIQGVNETTVGYYECTTAGSTPEKTITIDSSVSLSVRISCKVKFAEKNTGANATMNINGTGAKPLFYNGVRAAANNSWYQNEIVDLYFDGTNYQVKSCADILEYDVSLHQTHEITEVTTTTRTVVYNGDVTSGWENETSVSDSSVNGYTRTETNVGKGYDTTTVDGPTAKYDTTSNKTSVVYVTKRTLTHVVNDYTFDEAVNAVPMSYRHGGLKLSFISNNDGSLQNSDNKYVQYRLMANEWSTTVSDWQGVDDEPVEGSDNLVKSGGVADKISKLEGKVDDVIGVTTIIDLDNTPLGNGIIENGVWVALASINYKHIAVPMNGGIVKIHTNSSVVSQIAFLSDYVSPVADQPAFFCQGESIRSLPPDVELIFPIPDDCMYLYVRMANAIPQGVSVIKEGELDKFSKQVDELGSEVSSLKDECVVVDTQVVSNNKFDSVFDGVGYLSNGEPVANTGYKYSTKYYPIDNSNEYYYLATVAPESCWITWYDEDKQFLSRANMGNNTYRNAVKGTNAVYFRVDINASYDGLVYVGTTMNSAHKYEPYEEKSYFSKLARLRKYPIVSFVDDDCVATALNWLEKVVDACGVPITCALYTKPVGTDSATFTSWEHLRRLRGKGFTFVSHTNEPNSMVNYTDEEIAKSLSIAQTAMENHAMLDTQHLIYPQGGTIRPDGTSVIPVVSQYHKYGYLTSAVDTNSDGSFNVDNPNIIKSISDRYRIRRVSIDALNWDWYRKYIDAIKDKPYMVIFYGHAYHAEYTDEEIANYVAFVDYCKMNDCMVMSLPDAIKEFVE